MTEIKVLLLKPCLRIDEAAMVLDVTPRTVQRYLDSGKLTPVRMPGGHRRIKTVEIMRYMEI
jgi:excisionase family DNA binding protein